MQKVHNDGTLGELQELNAKTLQEWVKSKDVDHVDVFPGTKENIEHRKSLVGKKYKKSGGFKKAP